MSSLRNKSAQDLHFRQPGLQKRYSSGAHLGETSSPPDNSDNSKNGALPDFDAFPLYMREGPWSPLAWIFLICFGAFLIYTSSDAFASFPPIASNVTSVMQARTEVWATMGGSLPLPPLWVFWLVCAVYLVVFTFVIFCFMGWFPFVSYTMISWSFLTTRFVCVALMSWMESGYLTEVAQVIFELLRFPCLVSAIVTTSIWWLVLFPVLYFVLEGDRRLGFVKFNFSFFLLNVHLFNLPFAMMDHATSMRSLTFFDLWMGFVCAIAYFLFYLFFLDANQLHLYIILSPRPHWCVLVYSLIFGLYYGVFCMAQQYASSQTYASIQG